MQVVMVEGKIKRVGEEVVAKEPGRRCGGGGSRCEGAISLR